MSAVWRAIVKDAAPRTILYECKAASQSGVMDLMAQWLRAHQEDDNYITVTIWKEADADVQV